MILGPRPHLFHMFRTAAMDGDGLLEVARVRPAHSHRPPDEAWIVSETETKLGGGTEAGQEDVFQVDERRLEGAVQEGRDQGSCGDFFADKEVGVYL